MIRHLPALVFPAFLAALVSGCVAESHPDAPADGTPLETRIALGPVDGHDLPGVDLDRVAVGDTAPDFSLVSYRGPVVTLSDFRGEKDVVLVFYRGHW